MSTNVRDPQILLQILPTNVSSYLEQNGWQQVQSFEKATVWTRDDSDNEELEILLPLDRELQDFALRIGDILQTLAIAEKTSPQEIFQKLNSSPLPAKA